MRGNNCIEPKAIMNDVNRFVKVVYQWSKLRISVLGDFNSSLILTPKLVLQKVKLKVQIEVEIIYSGRL